MTQPKEPIEPTTRAEAKMLAEVILWLAEEDTPEVRVVLKRIRQALSLGGEVYVRNVICARLRSMPPEARAGEELREWVRILTDDPTNAVSAKWQDITDQAAQAAVVAWHRGRGERRGEAPEKWTATHALLKECGLAEGVTPEAIRRGWERRNK